MDAFAGCYSQIRNSCSVSDPWWAAANFSSTRRRMTMRAAGMKNLLWMMHADCICMDYSDSMRRDEMRMMR